MTKIIFDVIIAGDFRFQGGTSSAIAAEISALRQGNHSVALYHINAPMLASVGQWNERIQMLVERGDVAVLPADAHARCRVLLIRSPWLFVEAVEQKPQIEASFRILIINHASTDAKGRLNYDTHAVHRHATQCFGEPIVWAPISPVCRASFDRAGVTQRRLREDWTNFVDVDAWGSARSRLVGDRPVVGRHSRPQLSKWPATRVDLLRTYPTERDIVVKLLGVGKELRDLIEPVPLNWVLYDFNEVPVRQFLAEIDFFVYFHHPDLVETFGMAIAEAAAAGCVVITHPYLKATFGKAALYCPPEQAPDLIRAIASDREQFAERSAQGREAIKLLCGSDGYLERFRRVHAASQGSAAADALLIGPDSTLRFRFRSYFKRTAYWWRHRLIPRVQVMRQTKYARRFVRKMRKIFGRGSRSDTKYDD